MLINKQINIKGWTLGPAADPPLYDFINPFPTLVFERTPGFTGP